MVTRLTVQVFDLTPLPGLVRLHGVRVSDAFHSLDGNRENHLRQDGTSNVFFGAVEPPLDTFMQNTKRLYQDTRTQSNLTKLHEDLQDVTKIMTKNMEDLLYR